MNELINDFEGPVITDSAFKRIESRLFFITARVDQLRIPAEIDEEDIAEIKEFKQECHTTCIEIEASLYEKVQQSIEFPEVSNISLKPPVSRSTAVNLNTSSSSSHVNVQIYKCGVQFDGNSENLITFLERVSEQQQLDKPLKMIYLRVHVIFSKIKV